MKADEVLDNLSALYRERNAVYGDSYKNYGALGTALFPNGIELKTAEDFARWGVLALIMSKLQRYCVNFDNGGHLDSLQDLAVYAAMLFELDEEPKL